MLVQLILMFVFLLLLLRILQQRAIGAIFKAVSILLIVTAFYIVMFPEVTNRVAKFAGVGRGADLTIYICMAVGAYLLTVCYLRLKDTELRIARLVQHLALQDYRMEEATAQLNAGHQD